MFKRICAHAGCPCAIDYSERWCERHRDSEPKRIEEQDRGRHRYSEASPEKRVASRLYASAAWQSMRLARLRAEPLCRHCADQQRVTAATLVDHTLREIAPNTLAALVEAHLTEDDEDPDHVQQALIAELAYIFDGGLAADERELGRIEAALFEFTHVVA